MHNWQFTGNISQNSYGPHLYEKLVDLLWLLLWI